MPIDTKVKIIGNPNDFIVDCYCNGWVLLKREVKGVMKIVDWYKSSELKLV